MGEEAALESIPEWVMLRDRSDVAGLDSSRILDWDRVPDDAAVIESLRIVISDRSVRIPSCVRALPTLLFLSIPAQCAEALRSKDLPQSLRGLRIVGDKDSQFAAPLCLPELIVLNASRTKFTARSFPRLERAVAHLDRGGRQLAELLKLTQLHALTVGPIRTSEELKVLGSLRLTHLVLYRSELQDLGGIEKSSHIESLWISNFPQLKDVGAVVNLPQLRRFEVAHCLRLKGLASVISNLPGLEEFFGANCGDEQEVNTALAREVASRALRRR